METNPHQPTHEQAPQPAEEDEPAVPGQPDDAERIDLPTDPDQLRQIVTVGIAEAEAWQGEIDERSARAIATLLSTDPNQPSKALRRFAERGKISPRGMRAEYLAIYNDPATSAETRQWIDWLGTYLLHRQRSDKALDGPDAGATQAPPEQLPPVDPRRPFGTPLDQVSHYLDVAFAEADANGRAVDSDTARAIATLLAGMLPADSAMQRFADSGAEESAELRQECRRLAGSSRVGYDVLRWATRLDDYLQRSLQPPAELAAEHPQVTDAESDLIEQGVHLHGDAFRAFLQLPDSDPTDPQLLALFTETYVGNFVSMNHVLDELTEIDSWQDAVDSFADQQGLSGMVFIDRAAVARQAEDTWDIVRMGGRLYVFNK